MLNLSVLQTAKAIRGHIAQDPEGETGHHVWVGADPNSPALVHEFEDFTSAPDVLEFTPTTQLTNVQFVKIVTTQNPSRVAWREIEVIGE